ncbi:hypothetical protein DFH08DRAFT_797190 [Mycena albidolilacea]|uniref:Uncharacterized protein n=1 Tax=Mycena albidolilacea TaxID=1033008 RepID=A0AAD7AQK4_9AGAR|nr:hypothetical protein DFH08DRAFT_797190 [Mycena albidolilacea]
MCDAASTASIIFGALSLLPGNRYILGALVSAGLTIYTANRQRPSHKLGRVECAIEACEETLKHAKSNCARNHVELTDGTRRLFEAKMSASKLQSRLLETHSVATWEELVEYLLNLRDIMQKIKKCAKDVEGIQTSTLLRIQTKSFQLIIEAERRRQIFEGIKELREIHETVISASARHTQMVTRGFESIATSM